jgi:uncharacterized membrane protein YgcG
MGLFRRKAAPPLGRPAYRNESVIRRISEEEGVDRETASAWFEEMLIFLDLCADSKKVLAPSKPVDAAWHAFVLHTRDYEAYCRERFGRLIHHQPSEAEDRTAYARAYRCRETYPAGFDVAIWPVPIMIGTGQEERSYDDARDRGWSDPGSGDGGGDGGGSSCGGGGGCGGSG